MKVLMVNKFYYIKGGSETYYFALKRLLESHGHQVVDFSMQDERNLASPYSRFFVAPADYQGKSTPWQKLRMAGKIIWSQEAYRRLEQLIEAEKPDLAHLHLFQHQLSPSILHVLKKHHIPVVYTAHDLKMVCLNYKMMHHGHLCEDCRSGSYLPCLRNACVKNSRMKSAINVAEGYIHRFLRSYDAIDIILTPSDFYRRQFAEFGVDSARVIHLPNFLEGEVPQVRPSEDRGSYFLYLGRLSEEKGVPTLMMAALAAGVKLKIAGTGPLAEDLAAWKKDNGADNISLLGFQSGQALTDLLGNARAVVLPSEWYENGPYAAIEALRLGRPIIGAEIGGIPELVSGNGLLFPAGDSAALSQALRAMADMDDDTIRTMEEASKTLFARHYEAQGHYEQLMQAYRRAMEGKRA